jgi:ABC-type branched-subunit amino acid transport system substrate-binding protein
MSQSNNKTEPRLTGRLLELGGLMALSGPIGPLGKPISDAAKLAVTTVDESDAPVSANYQVRDTGTVPATGIGSASQLAAEESPAIVGALSSAVTLQATQQVTIPNDIVACSPATTSPTLSVLNDRGYVFRTAPSDAAQAGLIARLARQEHDVRSAATVHVNNDYGRQLSGAFTTSFDGTVTAQAPFDSKKGNYQEALEEALDADPEMLVVVSYVSDGIKLFQNYYEEFDTDRTVFVTDGLRDPTLPEKVEQPMDNVYGTAPLSNGPGYDWFNSEFTKVTGSEPGIYTAEAFDAAAVLLLANAAAGKNDGPAIRDSIDQVTTTEGEPIEPKELPRGIELAGTGKRVSYRGASGPITFDRNGDIERLAYEYFTFDEAEGIIRLDTIQSGDQT